MEKVNSISLKRFKFYRSIIKDKSCSCCRFLKSGLSWWCTNKECIKARGTRIPGCIHCPYWRPDKKYIRKQFK